VNEFGGFMVRPNSLLPVKLAFLNMLKRAGAGSMLGDASIGARAKSGFIITSGVHSGVENRPPSAAAKN